MNDKSVISMIKSNKKRDFLHKDYYPNHIMRKIARKLLNIKIIKVSVFRKISCYVTFEAND